MAKVVVMPKLGLTMVEGKVAKWHKEEGEEVKKGETLVDIETDKLTNQIEADVDGILRKIFVDKGDKAPVSSKIAIIADVDEDISQYLDGDIVEEEVFSKPEPQSKTKISEKVGVKKQSGYIRATPYAKKLAAEKNLDLSEIVGTGEEGRILAKNILEFEADEKVKISPTAKKMAEDKGVDISQIDATGRIMKQDILDALSMTDYASGDEEQTVEANNMRRIIAERMHNSWMTSPRVTYNLEIDVSNMKEFRESLKGNFIETGTKLSYNHILMKIVSKALIEYPYLNGSFNGEEIILRNYVNMGLAIDVGDGLLVPNVRNTESKSLLEIAVETEKLIEDTREGRLNPDTLEGGTFTITNIGMFGIDTFSPIINQPEVAILGVNRMVDKPVVIDGEIVIRPMMNLSLTADHRLVDGAMAAKFLARIKEIIENPYLLLM
ncbi:MAG: 2-oxo acid dehydrogenase subunit E2 [Tissierellia bacterium]|nr:2-oxo acid dehydrogenase subunit E2 [Tissierellia bacterium]